MDGFCPTATIDASGMTSTGTVDLKADKTYVESTTVAGSFKMVLPASCLMDQGQTITCAQLGSALMGGFSEAFSSATCAAEGSGCACTFSLRPSTAIKTGTWSTSGNLLTIRLSDGGADSLEYCVKGGELRVATGASNPTGQTGATPVEYILLTK